VPEIGLGNFNSTMVRLKERRSYSHIRGLENFNSTMVRLKADLDLAFSNSFFHFNSTMVRLKAEFICKDKDEAIRFQFHYGSVKSLKISTTS